MLILLSASALVAIASQLIIFNLKIRRGGLDPSLLTYASPLAAKDFWNARGLIFLAVVLSVLNLTVANAVWALVLSAAVLQILILLIFNRQYTQPAGYYLSLGLAAFTSLVNSRSYSLILTLALVLAGELYLRSWQDQRQRKYDDWVKKCALKINKQFRQLADELEPAHWAWVLHVAVTEHIARPAIVRLAERLYFLAKRPAVISTGIMQIAAERPLSDTESITAGSKRISEILAQMPAGLGRGEQLRWLAKHYNGSYSYAAYLSMTDRGVSQALQEIS